MDKKRTAKKKVRIKDLQAKNLSRVKGGVGKNKHDTAKSSVNNIR